LVFCFYFIFVPKHVTVSPLEGPDIIPQKMTGFVDVLWLKYTAINNFFTGLSDLINTSVMRRPWRGWFTVHK
jgi:hypothetical protein